ncbi:MBL fold metallo-hydrolase [Sciscionella marina]|uniref:MBL fold metallo-hydrolase n=1 Tax=Sciscionella marina TaxID=508770 RepID=UPI00037ABF52|nr:MBL fold metallo-hydrolase [Sciscionella marina]
MRVHHLNCGTMRPLGGKLIDGEPGLLRRAEMVCHCLLIEAGSELVLVETGMGTGAVERPAAWLGRSFVHTVGVRTTMTETAVHQVRALGHEPEDVRHIVLTHLDLDHAGGLADFPHATVHANAQELREISGPRYRHVQFAHGPKWQPHEPTGEPWYGFAATRPLSEIPAEVVLVPLAGHTRGHTGVAVRTANGWLLHAGDAYFHPGELAGRPHCPPALGLFESRVQTDRSTRLANQARLRELATHREITVVNAHSPAELARVRQPALEAIP